jgi:hypothetical protein
MSVYTKMIIGGIQGMKKNWASILLLFLSKNMICQYY